MSALKKNIQKLQQELNEKLHNEYKESIVLQTFIKLEIQRAQNNLTYKELKKLARIIKESNQKDTLNIDI